jgi:hypothetical protein
MGTVLMEILALISPPFDTDHDEKETNLSNNDDVTSSLDATDELMRWYLRLLHVRIEPTFGDC